MTLEHDSCYRALAARDHRFDGRFFVGVLTTGIYCRPICTARTPRADRCRFFATAAAAEKASFRPCLRCRPELAPGRAPVDAGTRLARLAADRLAAGAEGNIEALADELGLSSRQLRRVVKQQLGVSPGELARTHRMLIAKQLLTETDLPVTEVAMAAGFGSLRRFNALFKQRYNLTPSSFRRRPPRSADLQLRLEYRPPLAWTELLDFLQARAIPGVETVDGEVYRRNVRLKGHHGEVRVERNDERSLLLTASPSLARVLPILVARLRALFDLDADAQQVDAHFQDDPVLGPLVRQCPGLRVPGAFDGFELAWRAVLGQQVSVRGATTLSGRLVERFGEDGLSPTSEKLAASAIDDVAGIGLPRERARCLVELARAVEDGRVRLEPGRDPQATIAALVELPGIGPWTAHYVAMRALRWPDAFPHSDLVLKKRLGPNPERLARPWSPWRAYAAMHLWR